MTWHHAQMHCKRMGEGLVKITSARESEFVLAPVRERESTNKEVNVDRPDVDRKRLLLE